MTRARNLTAATLVVTTVTVVLLAFAGVPSFDDVANGILVLDTLSASASLLAALLVFGRFRRSALLSDVALVWAFFTLAVGNLLAAYLEPPERVKLVAGVLGALAVLVAAGARERSVGWRPATSAAAALAGLLAPALAIVGFFAVGEDIATSSYRLWILLVTGTGFGVGAVVFTALGDRNRDALSAWLGAGCVLAAASRLLYAMTDPPVEASIHLADIGRFLFAVFLVIGAVLEIRSYWQGVGTLEERRRVARELHDGMAQELATIVNETRRNRDAPPDAIAWYRISRAAERALDESRRAIYALISPLDQPLDEAVVATAEDVAAREGTEVSFTVDDGIRAPGAVREAFVRIVREAVGNAARHGQASAVSVDLKVVNGGLRLRVSDNGLGFSPDIAVGAGRVGLVSMQERAAAIGASFAVESSPGAGTTVEVNLPSLR